MRQIRIVVVISALASLIAAVPLPALAGGTGGECPSGLTQKLVKPNLQGGVRSRRRPPKITGFEAHSSTTQTTGGVTTKSYVWGEGGRISGKIEYVVLCGKLTDDASQTEHILAWSLLGLIVVALVGAITVIEVSNSKKLRKS